MLSSLKKQVENFYVQKNGRKEKAIKLFRAVKEGLERGELRAAEKIKGSWVVNEWVKAAILLGFKYGLLKKVKGKDWGYYEKDTLPLHDIALKDDIRIVPGGSSIRCGTYVSSGTIIMPPSYINIGSYIDAGCMIDSHVLVGSCAQIGKNVHLSAAAQIGGVLEPIGSMPVIIEDNVFIGGNCGVYQGVIIKENAVLGSGVILNSSMQIFDHVKGGFLKKDLNRPLTIPKNAVVIAGSRPIKNGFGRKYGIHIYCPVIIKYRDAKTNQAVTLEDILR